MKVKTLRRLIKLIKISTLAIPPVLTLIAGPIKLAGPDGPGGDPIPHDPLPI